MGRTPETVVKTFESPYFGKREFKVELFTWEKLDYVKNIKDAFEL
jgi:S-adenosylmethionine synthetase